MESVEDIDQLLHDSKNGDIEAVNRLWSLVLDQLFGPLPDRLIKIAESFISEHGTKHGQFLEPEDLIQEAYLQLRGYRWERAENLFPLSTEHLKQVAEYRMRQALGIKLARSKSRSGGLERVSLLDVNLMVQAEKVDDFLALDQALDKLVTLDERQAQIVEMHYFRGMSNDEIGQVLKVSVQTVEQELSHAIHWLRQNLDLSRLSATEGLWGQELKSRPIFPNLQNKRETETATKLFELQLPLFQACESLEKAQELAESTTDISLCFAPDIAGIIKGLIEKWQTTPAQREELLARQPFLEAMAEQHLPLQELTYAIKTETGYCQVRTRIEYVPDAAHPFGYVAFVKEISSLEPYQYEKLSVMPSVQWLQSRFPELQPTPSARTNPRKTGKRDRKIDPSHKNERMLTEVESPLDRALGVPFSGDVSSKGLFPFSSLIEPAIISTDATERGTADVSGKKQDRRPPRRHERIPERETKREYYREQLAALAEPGFLAGVKGEMERVNLDLERVEQEVKRIAREKEKVLEQFSGQISNEVITIQPITKGSPGFAENLARCCIVMELFPTLPSVQKAVREFVNANLRDNQSKIRPETKIHGTIAMSQKLPGYEFYWTQDRTSDRLRISLTQFLSLSQTNSR